MPFQVELWNKECTAGRSMAVGVQQLCWVPLRVGRGDAFMGGCSLKMSKMWTADFFCSVLNLSRLCWEQILWQNSAFSCGHSVLRGSYSCDTLILGYPKVSRGNNLTTAELVSVDFAISLVCEGRSCHLYRNISSSKHSYAEGLICFSMD